MTERVVGADWVAERLGDLVVVDVRDAWEYEEIGHLPGAVNVPFDSFRADEHGDGEGGMLPGADVFAQLAGGAGIDRDDHVVAHDDMHGVFAARFLVTAELYGHDPGKLHLLDGDYSAWSREREVSTETPEPTPTDYEATFRTEGPLVEVDAVQDATADPETILVDTREEWEFEEGHIPGAIRLDWRELVDDETRGLLPGSTLRERLEERGVTPDRHVLLYCNTARRISHTYIVLGHLGYDDLSFYEGSLVEWEQVDGELETGA